jgi:hypothetical protein
LAEVAENFYRVEDKDELGLFQRIPNPGVPIVAKVCAAELFKVQERYSLVWVCLEELIEKE